MESGLDYISMSILSCLGSIVSKFEGFRDLRYGSNTQYKMRDFVLGGFSLFLLNNRSFLEQQRMIKKRKGSSNYESLFGVSSIPSDAAIRDNLDEVRPIEVLSCYEDIYSQLDSQSIFANYKCDFLGFLVSIDGTQTIDSEKICCDSCNSRKLKNGHIQYYHSCVQAILSHPSQREVIPMEPEFIEAQSDCEKQDCEIKASKRWLEKHLDSWKRRLGQNAMTFIGDDLYAHEPFCNLLIEKGQHFIFICKPDSHKCLYTEIGLQEKANLLSKYSITEKVGKANLRYEYRFGNQLPIREATSKKDEPLKVNWVEMTVFNEKNEKVYYNSFITDFAVSPQNVHYIGQAGRNRWMVENQAFNALKNLGYHITHNFGHGKKYLANTLYALNILAFLFHNFLKITSLAYNEILKNLPKKSDLWTHISVLSQYIIFLSWSNLFDNIAESLDLNYS